MAARAPLVRHARHLATQAREPTAHYEHAEIGYNYRLSNVLAALGRAQLETLANRVARRREIFGFYRALLSDIEGVGFMPEASYGRCTRWLSCITLDPQKIAASPEKIRLTLESENIETRPVWKPMHLQPVFSAHSVIHRNVASTLFERGLCLPSGANLTDADLERVGAALRQAILS